MRSSLSSMGWSPCVQGKRYTALQGIGKSTADCAEDTDHGVTVIAGIKADKSGDDRW